MALESFVLAHEPAIRLGFFFAVFAVVALWEWRAPRRALTRTGDPNRIQATFHEY